MRMVKMKPKSMDLETAMQKFLLVKESQHTGEETMKGLPKLPRSVLS